MNNNINNNLFEPYQGFIRGNMFENLYDGFGKIYDVKPLNEQAELLTYIDIYTFACIDLALYLDIAPNDINMIKIYNQLLAEKENYKGRYEELYGPIDLTSDSLKEVPWSWNSNPWPWEG